MVSLNGVLYVSYQIYIHSILIFPSMLTDQPRLRSFQISAGFDACGGRTVCAHRYSGSPAFLRWFARARGRPRIDRRPGHSHN